LPLAIWSLWCVRHVCAVRAKVSVTPRYCANSTDIRTSRRLPRIPRITLTSWSCLMARITVDDCLPMIPNRFELTLVATQRARQLANGAETQLPASRDKVTVIALREVASGLVGRELLNRGL